MSGSSFRIEFFSFVILGCLLYIPSYSQEQKLIEQADSLYQQGIELYSNNQFNKAINLFEEVAALRKELFGETHPDFAISLNKSGNCYAALGDYDKALELYNQALSIIDN